MNPFFLVRSVFFVRLAIPLACLSSAARAISEQNIFSKVYP
jgi:hypothetical protein